VNKGRGENEERIATRYRAPPVVGVQSRQCLALLALVAAAADEAASSSAVKPSWKNY